MFAEVRLHLRTLKRWCVDLQLSEATENKTSKQTHPWILVRAPTSEKTGAPAHPRSGETQSKHPWALGPFRPLRTTTMPKKLKEFYSKQLKTYRSQLDNVFLSWSDRRADSLCSVQLKTNSMPQIPPRSHFNTSRELFCQRYYENIFISIKWLPCRN